MIGNLPLNGIRVVEFSHMVMGPSCGMILGDLGAEVIKVEPVGAGDNTRRLEGSGAGFFAAFNRNKKSVQVDLKTPDGMTFVKRLVASADVLTENFRPGKLAGLGLGYEQLSTDHPGLIYCSLKGFLSGPYAHRTALDEVVQMMGGLSYMTGPSGRPLRAGASVNDIMGGMFAVIGILAALQDRSKTGLGRVIASGLFENNMVLMASHMMQFAVTGIPAAPMPERVAAWAVYDVFDTSDGHQIFIGIVSDSQWAAFCDAFGLRDLATNPRLASNRTRVLARDTFLPRLRALFSARSRAQLVEACERIGLPFAPINRPQDLVDDPHLAHPGAMVDVTLPDGRSAKIPALPLEWDGKRFGLRLDLPFAGQHSGEIARTLGYDHLAIADLFASGVLVGEPD